MVTLPLPRPTFILLIITGFFVLVSLMWTMSVPPIGFVSPRKSASVHSASSLHMGIGHSGRENDHQCHPQQKVVYLKTHKTGSTTVASIFQRYGYLNNLTFLVPNRTHFINYRGMFSADHISHGTDVGYDLLTNHARYDKNELNKVFYNAKYVSILREPTSQFESAFYYFEIWRSLPRSKQPLTLFMENPRKHFEQVMGTRQYYKDSTHNQQMFDFGMSHKQMDDEAQVRKKIMELDSELDLVMITEYFDESLLLLRKMLCWQMEDIVYLPKATRSQNYRCTVDQHLRAKILTWNRADDMLYRHFNRSFWLKIKGVRTNVFTRFSPLSTKTGGGS